MANTRERVKDFPSIVGTIQNDDYIPVDGATQGVRKAQVSDIMNAPLSGLATAANTVKGAINEVATTAGKQDSMTQDEYDALPSSKESDNVARYITDGTPSTEDPLWAKVGTDRLDTEAPDCSGAINELKQSLSDLASELVSVTLSYNSSSSGFIIPNDVLTPRTEQICCPSRNIQSGAIYICWYDKSIRGFRIGATVSGNAPTNGQKCSFEYFA